MSRLHTPASISESPSASQPLLQAVKELLGSAPNLFRVVGNSPAGLEGYLGLNTALGKGQLDARLRQRLAIAVAEQNGCDYCLAAHTFLGKRAKLSDAELAAARDGESEDPKAQAALRFAAQVVQTRGHVSDVSVNDVKKAGFSDGEIVEIVLHVALNTLTNYVNTVAQTEIDFPVVASRN